MKSYELSSQVHSIASCVAAHATPDRLMTLQTPHWSAECMRKDATCTNVLHRHCFSGRVHAGQRCGFRAPGPGGVAAPA